MLCYHIMVCYVWNRCRCFFFEDGDGLIIEQNGERKKTGQLSKLFICKVVVLGKLAGSKYEDRRRGTQGGCELMSYTSQYHNTISINGQYPVYSYIGLALRYKNKVKNELYPEIYPNTIQQLYPPQYFNYFFLIPINLLHSIHSKWQPPQHSTLYESLSSS